MAGLATHASAEPDTLIVRDGRRRPRAVCFEDAPEKYYLTDYYRPASSRAGAAVAHRSRRRCTTCCPCRIVWRWGRAGDGPAIHAGSAVSPSSSWSPPARDLNWRKSRRRSVWRPRPLDTTVTDGPACRRATAAAYRVRTPDPGPRMRARASSESPDLQPATNSRR